MRKIINIICVMNISVFIGMLFGGYWMGHKYCLKLVDSRKLSDKHLHMARIYDIWMMTKQRGASIEKYLLDKNINRVAIYGMSFMGIRLFHELAGSSVHVVCGIDKDPKMRIPGIKICQSFEVASNNIDAVIVTAIFAFDSIKKNLEDHEFKKVIALDEILYDLI